MALKRNPLLTKKALIITAIGVVLIAGAILVTKSRRLKTTSGVIPVQDAPTLKPTPTPSTVPDTTKKTSDKTPAAGSGQAPAPSGQAPGKPYGTFVSNHSARLSKASSEESICQGTPGAKCYIVFTKDGVTKTLPTKTLDANGGATWSWDIKAAGFTTGQWTIKAISSLNGKTAETTDPIKLDVQP